MVDDIVDGRFVPLLRFVQFAGIGQQKFFHLIVVYLPEGRDFIHLVDGFDKFRELYVFGRNDDIVHEGLRKIDLEGLGLRADLILNGNPKEYLKNVTGSHGLED